MPVKSYSTSFFFAYFARNPYLIMGWIIIIAIKPLIQALGMAGFGWLLLGGLAYTFGVIFYVYDERVRHFHGIWHLFVLAGSTIQYFTVFNYVL